MKKILYVTNITRNVNSFFIPHINMLLSKGYTVDCACKISGEHKIKENKFIKKIKFYDIPVTRKPFSIDNFRFLYKLYLIQKNNNYDIIHVHSPIAGVYTRLLKICFKDVKIIYTAHGFHFNKNSSKISWMVFYNVEKILSKFTDILITINNEDFRIAKRFNCNKVIKIDGVGVELSEFKEYTEGEKLKIRKSLNLNEDDFILIMVGEHNKNKNQIQLIKAMEKISNKYRNVKAILIGDGEDIEKNNDYIEKNNVKSVKILGFRDDINELINASDVLVSMSYREGLPKNILEGMAVGKPIIATKIRGNVDLVSDGVNGFLVECGDIEGTISTIENIYKMNYSSFKKMESESKKIVKKYDVNKILDSLSKIYLSLF